MALSMSLPAAGRNGGFGLGQFQILREKGLCSGRLPVTGTADRRTAAMACSPAVQSVNRNLLTTTLGRLPLFLTSDRLHIQTSASFSGVNSRQGTSRHSGGTIFCAAAGPPGSLGCLQQNPACAALPRPWRPDGPTFSRQPDNRQGGGAIHATFTGGAQPDHRSKISIRRFRAVSLPLNAYRSMSLIQARSSPAGCPGVPTELSFALPPLLPPFEIYDRRHHALRSTSGL